MNIYVVVEGEIGEKRVYGFWVPLLNPSLTPVSHVTEFKQNNFLVLSGGGYPSYFDLIESAVDDIKSNPHIDRLVIAADSEDMSFQEKYDEINAVVAPIAEGIDVRIVVQHYCIETWALGNSVISAGKPGTELVRKLKHHYDVNLSDPELMSPPVDAETNRAQFAELYLRALLNAKYRNLTYTKSNPSALLHEKYYERVRQRYLKTAHINSFSAFLSAFV